MDGHGHGGPCSTLATNFEYHQQGMHYTMDKVIKTTLIPEVPVF